ncbi:MAG: hypothetical protein H6Q25_254 [Bacteroidetes bacterium]|nr:hypothetical protein [Bacteroidota bacterium]
MINSTLRKSLYTIMILIIIIITVSACRKNDKQSMPIVNVQTSELKDTLYQKFMDFKSSHQFSMMASYRSQRKINNNYYYSFLSPDLEIMYIYNYNQATYTQFEMPFSDGIDHIYFHNYDTIFIFMSRIFVYENKINGENVADLIIMDTTGKIKNNYSFDQIPYIYNGKNDVYILMNGFYYTDIQLVNGILYIPFRIFAPNISDLILNKYQIKLMCGYNLSTRKFKMLNITMPKQYIGHWYNQKVLETGFDFNFANDSTIYYSFTHSSDIFKYDIKKDTSILIKSFPDFYYNNIQDPLVDSGHSSFFKAPVYSSKENIYLRQILVYPDLKSINFNMVQILDKNMNLIGYQFEDSIWSFLNFDNNGNLICSKISENYNPYNAKIMDKHYISICDVEKLNPLKEKKEPIKKPFTSFEEYFKISNITSQNKIIMIPGDEVCGTCLNYLLNNINNQKLIQFQKIKIIFFNAKKDFYNNIEKNYGKVITGNSILDSTNNINGILKPEDVGKILLIKYENNKYSVVKATPSNIQQALIEFLK